MKSIYVIPTVAIGFPLITIMLYFGIGFQSFPIVAAATVLLTAIQIFTFYYVLLIGQFTNENQDEAPTAKNVDKWIKER